MAINLHRFANPNRFLGLSRAMMPWLVAITAVLLGLGLYYALFNSPPDYQQGDTVRIMYIHVPAAWWALGGYTGMAVASGVALVWRHPLADIAAQEMAPIGAAFTLIALVTGSLWGQPMWGTWWVWDARLTSVLILFFLYLGHMALSRAFDDPERGIKAARLLALVGWINIPIIKFSVDWWNTLHQPASVMKMGGPSIHPEMLVPLLLMGVAFMGLFTILLFLRMESRILARRLAIRRLDQLAEAE